MKRIPTLDGWRGVAIQLKLIAVGAGIIPVAYALSMFSPGSVGLSAFGTYWESGNAAASGLNPYAAYPLTYHSSLAGLGKPGFVADINLNPPALLPLFESMSHLSPAHFGAAWTIGSLLLFAAAISLLLVYRPTMQKRQLLWLLLAMPVFDTITGGQIYFLLLFLSAVAFVAAETKRELLSAVVLGLLVAIKPTTIPWPIFLLLSGRRRLALRSICVTAIVSLIPLALYGPLVYRQWLDAIKHDNHWQLPTDIAIPAYFNRFGLPTVGIAVAFALFLYLAWNVWTRRPSMWVTSAIALCAVMLCPPLAWYDYSLMLAPVFVALRWDKRQTAAAFLLASPYAVGVFLFSFMGQVPSLFAGGLIYIAALWMILIPHLRRESMGSLSSSFAALPLPGRFEA